MTTFHHSISPFFTIFHHFSPSSAFFTFFIFLHFHYFSPFFTIFHPFQHFSPFFTFFSIFFSKRHHHVCPQERKRTPKELRASRSVTTAKIHTQRPGRAKTVAREREPLRLRRLHRTVCFARLLRTSRKTGRTCTLRNGLGYNAAATLQPPRGAGKAP